MSLKKNLYSTVFWRGIVYALSFVLNILIARVFEAEISGNFFYLINIYSFVILVASLSIESGLGFYESNGSVSSASLVTISLLWSTAATIILGVIIYLTGPFTGLKNEFFYPGLAFILGNMMLSFFTNMEYARKSFFWPNFLQGFVIAVLIFLLILVTAGLLTGSLFLKLYLWSFLVSGLSVAMSYLVKFPTQIYFSFLSIPGIQKVFKYSMTAWVANLLFFLLYRIDYWFVQHFCSDLALGNYIQVSRLAQVFFVVPGIAASVIFPAVAASGDKLLIKRVTLLGRIFFSGILAVCILLAATGKWLFPLIFGNSFDMMYLPFLFLIPGILSLVVLYPLTAFNAGVNRIYINLLACAAALIVMVAGDWIFIPKYGIPAAAAVCSLSYLVFNAILMTDMYQHYKAKPIDFFLIRKSDLVEFGSLVSKTKK